MHEGAKRVSGEGEQDFGPGVYFEEAGGERTLVFAFIRFFPWLIAGPIVHHAEMMPQFRFTF